MVLLTTTPDILSAIKHLPPDSPLLLQKPPSASNDHALPNSLETPISHKTLVALSHALQPLYSTSSDPSSNPYTLNTLLHQTSLYLPPPTPPPQPSAAYLALKARLLREQERRQYNALLANPNHKHPSTSLFANIGEEEVEADDISPTLVLNITLSVLLCALAVFYASAHVTVPFPFSRRSGNGSNDGLRVLLSLVSAIMVGVAESVIYAAYLRKVRRAKAQEIGRRERKEVVSTEKVEGGGGRRVEGRREGGDGGDDDDDDDVVVLGAEKEEIWGRGVNGGMRRRVREKWEKDQQLEREKTGQR